MKKEKKNSKEGKITFKDRVRMYKGIRIPWLHLILIAVSYGVMVVFSLMMVNFTGDMVDENGDLPMGDLIMFAVSYIGIGICSSLSVAFQGIAGEKINLGLRKKLWNKIMRTKQSAYDADGGETLVSRVTTDCDYASKLIVTLISLVSAVFSAFGMVTSMLATSAEIGTTMLILIPVSIIIGYFYTKIKYKVGFGIQQKLAETTAYLVERTGNLSLVKTSNSSEKEIEIGNVNFSEQYKLNIKNGILSAFYSFLQTAYNTVCIVIPFVIGAKLVSDGTLTSGDVITFYGLATNASMYFTNVIDDYGTVRLSNGALERIVKTMDLPEENVTDGKEMTVPDEDVSFSEVYFGYGEENVLENVCCTIPKNKVTAIVGANGSGKSTVFKLIERLYEPAQGSISFGSVNASEYSLKSWRSAFRIVGQNIPLMDGTIKENICYGCERKVSDDELEQVAKLANVYGFVKELPDGFDTKLSNGGDNLSGGQKQCIAIARAIMSSPDYLLLDEATSNLDAKAEKSVMDALSNLMKDKTTVIIAHSLASVKNVDHVIIMKDGKVQTEGSPEKVMEQTGNYLEKVIGRRAVNA